MRTCMQPQSAFWHQTSSEEDAIKAVEPSLSVLMMGIPYFTACIAAGPAVRRVR